MGLVFGIGSRPHQIVAAKVNMRGSRSSDANVQSAREAYMSASGDDLNKSPALHGDLAMLVLHLS